MTNSPHTLRNGVQSAVIIATTMLMGLGNYYHNVCRYETSAILATMLLATSIVNTSLVMINSPHTLRNGVQSAVIIAATMLMGLGNYYHNVCRFETFAILATMLLAMHCHNVCRNGTSATSCHNASHDALTSDACRIEPSVILATMLPTMLLAVHSHDQQRLFLDQSSSMTEPNPNGHSKRITIDLFHSHLITFR